MREIRGLAFLLSGAWSLLLIPASSGLAQNPVQPIFATCPPVTRVYSAREVQVAAKPRADSTRMLRIVISPHAGANMIAFVVDTLGVPEQNSIAALQIADSSLWRQAQVEFRRWRFEPARASGCRVRQRVVAAVTR
jgi:hypothetical protein